MILRKEISVWLLAATYGRDLWRFSYMVSGVLLIVVVHTLMRLELSVDSLDITHIVRF